MRSSRRHRSFVLAVAAATVLALGSPSSAQQADDPYRLGGSIGETNKAGDKGKTTSRQSPNGKSGRLTTRQLTRVIRAHKAEIVRCVEARLAERPKLAGKVYMRWTITRQGKVRDVREETKRTTLKDEKASQCIRGIVATMQFPSPKGGELEVLFPWLFKLRAGIVRRADSSLRRVGGSLTEAELERVLGAHHIGWLRCYESRLTKRPGLVDTITLGWTVTTKGRVKGARVVKAQDGDKKLSRCLVKSLTSMRFPRPKGGELRVQMPLVVEPMGSRP